LTAIRHTPVPDSFGLSVSQVSACGVWLHASGELDLAAADTLRDLLDSENGAGHRFARLEVSHVTHVGAQCLTVLQ
jgi:anti-anti-sigma regulatory factor